MFHWRNPYVKNNNPLIPAILAITFIAITVIFGGLIYGGDLSENIFLMSFLSITSILMIIATIKGLSDNKYFKSYNLRLRDYASRKGYGYQEPGSVININPSLLEISKRDKFTENVIKGKNWSLRTFSYAIYNRYNKQKTILYSVMTIPLDRNMPHMLFDSKKSNGRQYRALYDHTQRQKLEANFEKHFTTYFPRHYSIDGRSIIGPEVMEALIQADEYDIEIAGSSLYLSSPLVRPDKLEDIINKGTDIYRSIEHEVNVYKDSFLTSHMEREAITSLGATLRRNPYRSAPIVIFGAVFVIAGFFGKSPVHFLIGVFIAIGAIGHILGIIRENTERDKLAQSRLNDD